MTCRSFIGRPTKRMRHSFTREPRLGVPHISPFLGEMWERNECREQCQKVRSAAEISPAASVNSRISPTESELWAPQVGAIGKNAF